MISTPTGSTTGDQIGSTGWGTGVQVFSSGDYVVASRYWDHGEIVNAQAVTWCSATAGVDGPVSPANSLVAGTDNDRVGYATALPVVLKHAR